MNVVFWGAVQHLMSDVTNLKGEITKLKANEKGKAIVISNTIE